MTNNEIENRLFELRDDKYRQFKARLVPNVPCEQIIGVRIPNVRAFAKQLVKSKETDGFIAELPHKYTDENNLHGFIISECKDYDKTVKYLDEFLPYIDNWETCDILNPKAFKKNKTRLKGDIFRWLSSQHTYTVRFGIEMAMAHFLDDDFDAELMDAVSKVKSDEYYVNMMIAWYFATALSKQWDSAVIYLQNNALDKWVHNKTVQKAIESYRITDAEKNYLRSIKIRG